MQNKIQEIIEKTVADLGLSQVDFVVEHPTDTNNGDYSANVALVTGGRSGSSPKELAEKIKAELEGKMSEIAKIEIAGSGFINFYLTDEYLSGSLKEILDEGESFGQSDLLKGQKIFLEHTQPNPFKEFHIGHLMNNAIGESIGRLLKANDAEVKIASYHGDVGLHVAKAIWGKIQKPELEWGKAYVYGAQSYDQYTDEIVEINKKVYDQSDEKINKLYQEGKEESLDHFESIYKKLDSHFDVHFFESEAGEIGKEIVKEDIGEVFEESEGAIIFRGEKFGLHTRVFLNSHGLPTYEAKEIGLAKIKKEKFDYNWSITITANEQDDFFKVIEVAIGEVFPDLKGKMKHLSHGMLRLPSGKMSSRTGDVITAEALIGDVKTKVLEKMKESELGETDPSSPKAMTGQEKNDVAEMVTIGAIKYSILKQTIGKDIIFDFAKSISFEGDSGPYLQYTYVRTQSVLAKARELGLKPVADKSNKIYGPEKLLYRFPEVVARAAQDYAPSHLVTYLVELASSFNSFYAVEKIADSNLPDSAYRLALAQAVGIILKNGLTLLAIKTPEKM